MAKVFCKKYKKELDALPFPPIPGEKGMNIMQSFSKEAWDAWVDLQTMLINEQMSLFLNNENYEKPSGFVKPD